MAVYNAGNNSDVVVLYMELPLHYTSQRSPWHAYKRDYSAIIKLGCRNKASNNNAKTSGGYCGCKGKRGQVWQMKKVLSQ